MEPILLTASGNPENQDRGIILHDQRRLVLCVADGAGGCSGGLEAAIMATEFVRQNASLLHEAESCTELLREMDRDIHKD